MSRPWSRAPPKQPGPKNFDLMLGDDAPHSWIAMMNGGEQASWITVVADTRRGAKGERRYDRALVAGRPAGDLA